jgi:hypothetical protein
MGIAFGGRETFRDLAAWREVSSLACDTLNVPPQFYFFSQQLIACRAIFCSLIGIVGLIEVCQQDWAFNRH